MDKEKFMNSDIFKQLPEETREKLLQCTSEEEAMAILKDEMVPVSAEELQAVAGGDCLGPDVCKKNICDQLNGDTRENMDSEKIAKDFEEGRVTGADFF